MSEGTGGNMDNKEPHDSSQQGPIEASGRARMQPPGERSGGESSAAPTPEQILAQMQESFDRDKQFEAFKNSESGHRMEEMGKLFRIPEADVTPEDLDKKNALAEQLYTDAQNHPEMKDQIKAGLEITMGEEWVNQRFPKEEPDVDAVDITQKESDELINQANELKDRIRTLNEDSTQEDWDAIQHDITKMGDHHATELIKTSQGRLARYTYYTVMSSLVLLWLIFGTTKLVSRAAGGGGK